MFRYVRGIFNMKRMNKKYKFHNASLKNGQKGIEYTFSRSNVSCIGLDIIVLYLGLYVIVMICR